MTVKKEPELFDCDECGAKDIPADALFCPQCGIEFESEQESETEPDRGD